MENKKMNLKFIAFFMILALIIIFNFTVFADVGGIQRYDGSLP